MLIKAIYAEDLNGVIGDGEKMLWYIPDDFRHFREKTLGYPMIMGRKTFESLPGVLDHRPHIVISRSSPPVLDEGVYFVRSFEKALRRAEEFGRDKVWVIGGGNLLSQFIDEVDEVHKSIIQVEVETLTPVYSPSLEDFYEVSDTGWYLRSGDARWRVKTLLRDPSLF